jgi:hypothetical protein
LKIKILAAVLLIFSLASAARAQVVIVPDYPSTSGCPELGGSDKTQCSGYQVRQGFNASISGANPIAPSYASITVTTSTLIPTGVAIVFANPPSGSIMITLPAALMTQSALTIKNESIYSITVQRNGSDTIDGGTSVSLPALTALSLQVSLVGAWAITVPATMTAGGAASGDLSNSFPAPIVVATHLTNPFPVAQGGRQCGAPGPFASLPHHRSAERSVPLRTHRRV